MILVGCVSILHGAGGIMSPGWKLIWYNCKLFNSGMNWVFAMWCDAFSRQKISLLLCKEDFWWNSFFRYIFWWFLLMMARSNTLIARCTVFQDNLWAKIIKKYIEKMSFIENLLYQALRIFFAVKMHHTTLRIDNSFQNKTKNNRMELIFSLET